MLIGIKGKNNGFVVIFRGYFLCGRKRKMQDMVQIFQIRCAGIPKNQRSTKAAEAFCRKAVGALLRNRTPIFPKIR